MKTPESIFSRSGPSRGSVSPRTTAPGAETVTTLPLPGPTRTAPGSPSTRQLAGDPDRARDARRPRTTTTSPSAARSTIVLQAASPGATDDPLRPAGATRPAARAAASPRRTMVRATAMASRRLRLDQHAALHLHVHRVAEPGAVVPVHARLARP